MIKYLKVWWLFAISSVQMQLIMRWALAFLLFGKLLRFSIFIFFIIILVSKTKVLAGYSLNQTIFFFLSFNLVDMSAQLILREVYRFRGAVISGNFDFTLIKPYNPLFRSLTSGPDLLDFITFIPLICAIAYFMNQLQIAGFVSIALYIILIICGFIIALSFHILVLSLAILTTEIDHALWIYRDITSMGRFPVDIYREPIRGLLTFIVPVGIMMSFPVKAVLGVLSPILIIYALVFSLTFFYLSLKVWNFALKKYSSASS